MAEIEQEVKTYNVDYICDDCGMGNMRPTNLVLTSYPPQYPHVCNKCKVEKVFRGEKYPFRIYRIIP